MKAIAQQTFGGPEVLQLTDLPEPTAGDGQVLVRVRAGSVNPLDTKVRKGELKIFTGSAFPRVLGADFAGDVVKVPASVSGFKPGDRVCGMVDLLARNARGANSELAAVPLQWLHRLPDAVSYLDAACLPVAAGTSLYVLKGLAPVGPGKSVLVNGATGGVGSFMVQVGKLLGARVSAVCHSRNAAFASELGADEVLPYDVGDFRGRGSWDVIVDVADTAPFNTCGASLAASGVYVTLTPGPKAALLGPPWSLITGKKVKMCLGARAGPEFMREVLELVAQKRLEVHRTETLPLAELAKAHALLERGGKGKIAIEVP